MEDKGINDKKTKDLDYFGKLNYEYKVRKSGDRFAVSIPELAIIESGEDLNETMAAVERAKTKYFTEVIANGFQDVIPECSVSGVRSASECKRGFLSEMFSFTCKFFIGTFIIIFLLFGVVGVSISHKLNKASRQLTTENILKAYDKAMDRVANIPPERRRDLIEKMKPLAQIIKESGEMLAGAPPAADDGK